jgi:hypothetical protein
MCLTTSHLHNKHKQFPRVFLKQKLQHIREIPYHNTHKELQLVPANG